MSSSSYYLGPRRPRLQLSTWADVTIAASAGVLDENQWVELKQAVPPSSRAANLELAKDLASLSVDGGLLIIGIEDAAGSAGQVVGTALDGLQSRIAQVAAGRIAPPLPVTIDVIQKPDDPPLGVVVVTAPASEGAPHMVDSQYWGRSAHGKRVLSDDEVRRVLLDRQARTAGFAERVRALPGRLDPPQLGDRGRLYILLEPGAASKEPLADLLAGKQLLQLAASGLRFDPQWGPSFRSLTYVVPHPDGIAAASVSTDAAEGAGHEYFFGLLGDDGSLYVSAPGVRPYGHKADAPEVLSPGQLLETVHAAVALAAHIADEYVGYQGPWRIGVLVTKLRGIVASQAHSAYGFQRFLPFPSEEYFAVAHATTREMADGTPAVVERVAKNLLRGLGVDGRFFPYREPADLIQRGG